MAPTERGTRDGIFEPISRETPNLEEIYARLVQQSTGGTRVMSMKAPALSMEYVKSRYANKASAQNEGALIDIEFPSTNRIKQIQKRRHGRDDLFGFVHTAEADAFPAGYGEVSAQSLEREDSAYQLKSSFTSAAISMTKLRARVAARGGDATKITEVFANMWGIKPEEAAIIPDQRIVGKEGTRVAAMEDRAYHALSVHPAAAGGYRVDLASITPDELGDDVPINWARLRTGAKAIAHIQAHADIELRERRRMCGDEMSVPLRLDLVFDSQPHYRRTYAWEVPLYHAMFPSTLITGGEGSSSQGEQESDVMMHTMLQSRDIMIAKSYNIDFSRSWMAIANMVRFKSRKALETAIKLIEMHSEGRKLLTDEEEAEVEELERAEMGRNFVVPECTITTKSLQSIMKREYIGPSKFPDIVSHGKGKLKFDLSSIRKSGLDMEMTLPNALMLATYISTMRQGAEAAANALMGAVRDPDPEGRGAVAGRLRNPALFQSSDVRKCGKVILGDSFIATLECLIRNMVPRAQQEESALIANIQRYVISRYGRLCKKLERAALPELIEYYRDAPEGWIFYYWARVSIGKWHYASQTGILAPIAAGEEVDMMVAFKKGVQMRAKKWEGFYAAQYKENFEKFKSMKKQPNVEKKLAEDADLGADEKPISYIPPHRRYDSALETLLEESGNMPGDSTSGMEKEFYEKMATSQVKRKFFRMISVQSYARSVSVGISDADMRDLLVHSYQVRWLSIERRLRAALEAGEVLHIGPYEFSEHPWGEFRYEFPENLHLVREEMRELDGRAWTVDPDDLWDKLSKSINELWMDLSQELDHVVAMIEEKNDDPHDDQAYANLEERARGAASPWSAGPSLEVSNFGFRPTYKLPPKNVIVEGEEEGSEVTVRLETSRVAPNGEDDEEGSEGGWDDDEDTGLMESVMLNTPLGSIYGMQFGDMTNATATERPALTYRQIAERLGLSEYPDDLIVRGFSLPGGYDLDTQHKDTKLGPMILADEAGRTHKAWSSRLSIIKMRMGIVMKRVEEEDM